MPTPPSERAQHAKLAAHISWAYTEDRSARTANGRKAFKDKFLAEADGDPVRAEHLRKAFYARLALKSAQARRRRREGAALPLTDEQRTRSAELQHPVHREGGAA